VGELAGADRVRGRMLCFNFFFLPPVYTLTIADPQNWIALVAFLVTAVTAGQLSELAKRRAAGLGAFISCLRKLNAKGGDLKLCGMSKQVRAVFELVRMHRVFDIHATSEQAVRAFAS
jgi:K+-sensing histidine kinase KdpD